MSGLTFTRTLTVNPAFLQEIKDVNEELWQTLDELRHRCQRPIAPGHCRQLLERFATLRDQLALHFALEEAYGYFEDPAYVPVDMGECAERLRQEHRSLYLSLCRLVEQAEALFYGLQHTELAAWIGPEFLKFDRALCDHESRENELILDAFDSDIGGCD